jgi:rare lipoprotein A
MIKLICITLLIAVITIGVAEEKMGEPHAAEDSQIAETQDMVASYYGNGYHGRKTASGEVFDQYAMTCAHKTLPFGTMLWVFNEKTGKGVFLTVNDRGPFIEGRHLDVSYGAAKRLGMIKEGVIKVKVNEVR